MSNPIHIDPEVMRTVANQHDDIADQIRPAREASADILAAVNTYGPIMHQFKSAISDLMANRDAALLTHEHTHRDAAIGRRAYVLQDALGLPHAQRRGGLVQNQDASAEVERPGDGDGLALAA